jgi:hypothetical protein
VKNSLFILLALTLFPAYVFAVDGVVLINQSTVNAAGGFPYSITAPGSYKLSGNLTPPSSTGAIQISSDDVTLDLAGFAIVGNVGAFDLTPGITDAGQRKRIVIRNGFIRGFHNGILLTNSSRVLIEQMNVNSCVTSACFFSFSITVGQVALPANSIVRDNITDGLIQASCPTVVTSNVAFTFDFTSNSPFPCSFSNNIQASAP